MSALEHWRRVFAAERADVEAVFVFAYRIEKPAVDEDGLRVYDDGGRRYVFLAVGLADYRRCMRRRSPRWKTVSLSAGDFRSVSFPAERIWTLKRTFDECDNHNIGEDNPGRRDADGRSDRAAVGGIF